MHVGLRGGATFCVKFERENEIFNFSDFFLLLAIPFFLMQLDFEKAYRI